MQIRLSDLKSILFFLVFMLWAAVIRADPGTTTSTFTTDAEGWSTTSSSTAVTHNPEGHICADAGFWKASLAYSGNLEDAYGSSLTFDLKQSGDSGYNTSDDVILVGAGMRLTYDTPANPGNKWTVYRVPLDVVSGWKIDNTQEAPTEAEMRKVLANLTDLLIRGDFSHYGGTGCIDNVTMRAVAPPRPVGTANGFDVNNQNWASLSSDGAAVWQTSGGNPRGHLCANAGFWSAPLDFLGDLRQSYGFALTFDLKRSGYGDLDTSDDVILVGNGLELRFSTYVNPGLGWTSYRIPLDETAGWTIGDTTDAPTHEEFLNVLASVDTLLIRGNFSRYGGEVCIDNVVLDNVPAIRPVGRIQTFDTDAAGWSTVKGGTDLQWNSAGGNPRGNLCANAGFWSAPTDFMGDLRKAYGLALTFDLKQQSLNEYKTTDDVILVGNGIELHFDAYANPGIGWTSYRIPLHEKANWKIGSTAESPTRDDFLKVLASVNSLLIRGNFSRYGGVGCIDNVVLQFGDDPVATLITYYYQSILGRAPESAGLAYYQDRINQARAKGQDDYQDRINQARAKGQDVKPEFKIMAYNFLNSPEYLNRGTSNTAYITTLYKTFLQREPESAGLAYYLDFLAKGVTRNSLLDNFVNSPEFANFMKNLGF
ncbi:hypothetical protein CCP4SC76_7850002 [Gammaproteobacteria bacterium]